MQPRRRRHVPCRPRAGHCPDVGRPWGRTAIMASLAALAFVPPLSRASVNAQELEVELANGTEAERRTRDRLLELVDEHDVSEWIYTRRIVIDETQIPHSHPVLTIHTRHLGEDHHLLATFLHEQFHWLEQDETLAAFRAAMEEYEALYPEVPTSENGGARDRESTYRHLLVCDLELQAMTRLIGPAAARATLASTTHYEWIYARVLEDARIREVAARHGFVLD